MPMHWMGFDIEAMAKPKTPADILAVLKEVRAEAENVNAHLQRLLDEPAPQAPSA